MWWKGYRLGSQGSGEESSILNPFLPLPNPEESLYIGNISFLSKMDWTLWLLVSMGKQDQSFDTDIDRQASSNLTLYLIRAPQTFFVKDQVINILGFADAILWCVRNIYISGLHPQLLAHRSQNHGNFLSYKNNGSIFCYDVWSPVLSSWKCFRAIKVTQVSCYS